MEKTSFAALRVAHLGKILSNFAILGAVICIASVAYFLFILVYYLVLISILLCTLFLILVEHPEFMNLFSNTEVINDFVINFSVTYLPVIAPVTMAVSALSIAALAVSKQKDGVARMVISIICLVVAAVFTILYTFMGGGAQ